MWKLCLTEIEKYPNTHSPIKRNELQHKIHTKNQSHV